MTKIVICQLRVTLDRIRNSWDVYTNTLFLSMLGHSFDICIYLNICFKSLQISLEIKTCVRTARPTMAAKAAKRVPVRPVSI